MTFEVILLPVFALRKDAFRYFCLLLNDLVSLSDPVYGDYQQEPCPSSALDVGPQQQGGMGEGSSEKLDLGIGLLEWHCMAST